MKVFLYLLFNRDHSCHPLLAALPAVFSVMRTFGGNTF